MTHIVVPDLGEGIDKVEIALWHKKPGEFIEAGEDIVEVVTDKASFNVPSPAAGRIANIYCKEGQEARIGAVLADIA